MLTEKINMISEFQNLVDISNEKFKIFEETNLGNTIQNIFNDSL